MIKGFFFDLDGTLVDTHEANFQAYRRALNDFAVELTFASFKETIGQHAKEFLPRLAPGLNDEDYKIIADKKAEYYKDLMHLSKLNTALLGFIEYVKSDHVVALVTTARRQNAQAALDHHGLTHHFEYLITAEDVTKSKPSPEGYKLALERSGLQPSEVIAFEDSESGRQAAEAAGIAVIMVKDFLL